MALHRARARAKQGHQKMHETDSRLMESASFPFAAPAFFFPWRHVHQLPGLSKDNIAAGGRGGRIDKRAKYRHLAELVVERHASSLLSRALDHLIRLTPRGIAAYAEIGTADVAGSDPRENTVEWHGFAVPRDMYADLATAQERAAE